MGTPDTVLWIRNESHPPGREVKIYLSVDSHVSDVAAKAAELLKFGGERRQQVDLIVRNDQGEPLPMMMAISDLPKNSVSLVGLGDDAQFSPDSWARAKSWAPEMTEHNISSPTGRPDGLPMKSDTSYGYDFVQDDDAELLEQSVATDQPPSPGSSKVKPAAQAVAPRDSNSDEGVGGRSNSWSGALEEDDGMPSRGATRTWHAGADDAEGFDGIPPRSQTCEIIGMDEEEEGGGGDGGDGGVVSAAPAEKPRIEDRFYTNPNTRRPKVASVVPEEKREVSFVPQAYQVGVGSAAAPPPAHAPAAPAPLSMAAGGQHGSGAPHRSSAAGAGAVWQGVAGVPSVSAVYVDRIPPDVSDAMIRVAINSQLEPYGVDKVRSLEVIRNQKTRHCHAFAFLTCPPPAAITPLQLEGTDEYIRVQSSDKAREVPAEVPVRATLHIRMYARRKGWVTPVTRMEWPGLLAVLEDIEPNITDCMTIIADDRSRKNLQVHKSVCLCAFFVECRSVAEAKRFRDKIHDQRTRNAEGCVFLIQCDYTMSDKRLHDTCKQLEQLRRNYAQAVKVAKQFARQGRVPRWPAESKNFFKFSRDHQHVEWGSDEDEDDRDCWRPPTAVKRGGGGGGNGNGGGGAPPTSVSFPQQQRESGRHRRGDQGSAPGMRGMAALQNLGTVGMGMGMGMGTLGDVRTQLLLQQQQQQLYQFNSLMAMSAAGLGMNATDPMLGMFPKGDGSADFNPFFTGAFGMRS